MTNDGAPPPAAKDVRRVSDAALAAAKAAGDLLLSRFGGRHHVRLKGPIDPTTEVDVAAEDLIISILAQATPEASFLAEERGLEDKGGPLLWIIDPLDGTVNFSSGIARFGVSIALVRSGVLDLGVVFNPLRDEMFLAMRGAGAWKNGAPISLSTTPVIADAVLSTGFPYDAWTDMADNTDELRHFIRRVRALRVTGSASLDLADVACGRSDGHWERGLSAYDVAGGVILVREGGGNVSDYSGSSSNLDGGEIIACNTLLHGVLLDYLKGYHTCPSQPPVHGRFSIA